MLRKVKVQALLKQLVEARHQRLGISADRILQQLARVAFFDPRRLFNQDGSLKDITELDDDSAAAIAEVEIATGSEIPVKSRASGKFVVCGIREE